MDNILFNVLFIIDKKYDIAIDDVPNNDILNIKMQLVNNDKLPYLF